LSPISGPKERESFLCPDCGKILASLRGLRFHQFTVHGIAEPTDEEKIIACPYCDKTFICQSKLRHHVESRHEDYRPYKCPECAYRSNAFFTLKTHFRMVHKRNLERRFVKVDHPACAGCKPYVIFDKDTGEEMVTVRNLIP
jgi:predicted RNA-binding Zn-ribbon protein involved in translation (DUF1610 family)